MVTRSAYAVSGTPGGRLPDSTTTRAAAHPLGERVPERRPLRLGDVRARFVEDGRRALREDGHRPTGLRAEAGELRRHAGRRQFRFDVLAGGTAEQTQDDCLGAQLTQHPGDVEALAPGTGDHAGDPVRRVGTSSGTV